MPGFEGTHSEPGQTRRPAALGGNFSTTTLGAISVLLLWGHFQYYYSGGNFSTTTLGALSVLLLWVALSVLLCVVAVSPLRRIVGTQRPKSRRPRGLCVAAPTAARRRTARRCLNHLTSLPISRRFSLPFSRRGTLPSLPPLLILIRTACGLWATCRLTRAVCVALSRASQTAPERPRDTCSGGGAADSPAPAAATAIQVRSKAVL
jgi:hypothetical protein